MRTATWLSMAMGLTAMSSTTIGCTNANGSGSGDSVAVPDDAPALDQTCPGTGTLTARELLGGLRRRYTGTYIPQRGSTSTTPLTILVSYSDGKVVCTPATSCYGKDPQCTPAALSVEVDLVFETGDGTFHEAFRAPITRVEDGPNLIWSAAIAGKDVKGNYRFTEGTRDEVALAFVGNFNYPAVNETSGGISEKSATTSAGGGTW